ncbi:MAG: PKD domain-containing protein [Deltaproteobacteria bacterium]|nr:PKD domain-containing protein [Deltaproteobacteria bacterium]
MSAMRRSRFAMLLGCALLATDAAAQVDSVLPLKGSYTGVIDGAGSDSVLRTEGVAGSLLTVTVKAKNGLIPVLSLLNLAEGEDVDISGYTTGAGSSKLKVLKVPLPRTGPYELRVAGVDATAGNFTLTSVIKLPGDAKKVKASVQAEETTGTLVSFDALASTMLSGSLKLIGAGGANLPDVILEGPLGGIDLTTKLMDKGGSVVLGKFELPSIGTYRVSLAGPVPEGTVLVSLKAKPPKAGGSGKPSALVEVAAGHLALPPSAAALAGQLEVLTLAGASDVPVDGGFTVESPPASTWQPLIFREKTCGKPVFLGLRDPKSGEVQADVQSTATALVLLNPYLLYADEAQREDYLAAATTSSSFANLVAKLNTAYATDPCTALDLNAHPEVYTALAEAMVAALEAAGPSPPLGDGGLGDPPYVVDEPGPGITIINPRHVFYAIAKAGLDGVFVNAQRVERKEAIVVWKWPFEFSLDPAETSYALGDGSFELWITKGSLLKLFNMQDPEGLAATHNLAQSIVYLIELLSGYLPKIPLEKLPLYIQLDADLVVDLEQALIEEDVTAIIEVIVELMQDQATGLAKWLLASAEEGAAEASQEFLKAAGGLLKNVAFALKVLEAINEQGPFFWDLVVAPQEVTYHVTQSAGVITSFDVNTAPVVTVDADPPAGIVGTNFVFDASGTVDNADPVSSLQFRWDFEADGTWDTSWLPMAATSHAFDAPGAKTVIAAAMDQGGLIGFGTTVVNVGGGAGTASHVKLFRDALPWDTNATVTTLTSLGFAAGTGPDTYEVLPSSQMATASLIPGEDLVVISNDQPQVFYDNYADAHLRFVQFVQNGGSLLWGACDLGWKGGSMAAAGIVLPGGVVPSYSYQNWNYVVAPDLPLMAGLPTAMDHNYASHERFTNLPLGTTTYMVDGSGLPTLIEFSLGLGWVIVTGQPLEHQATYVYGAPDMAALLPAVLGYFTGAGPQPPLGTVTAGGPGPASAGTGGPHR